MVTFGRVGDLGPYLTSEMIKYSQSPWGQKLGGRGAGLDQVQIQRFLGPGADLLIIYFTRTIIADQRQQSQKAIKHFIYCPRSSHDYVQRNKHR